MDIVTGHIGWIEVVCGPMFSGKSEELIRRLRRAKIARKRVQVFKPVLDVQYIPPIWPDIEAPKFNGV